MAMPGIFAAERDLPKNLFLHWLALQGLLVFIAVVLGEAGIWRQLHAADPTGVTQLIVLVFVGLMLWAGARAWQLDAEAHALAQWRAALLAPAPDFRSHRPLAAAASGIVATYFDRLLGKPPDERRANAQLTDILADELSGAHESAWWVNGLLLKLGLLGTVVGFILMAFQVAGLESFDPAQAQALLKGMTRGMGVALLTTLVGLIGNMLAGWQLLRLDRAADAMLGQALALAETRVPLASSATCA